MPKLTSDQFAAYLSGTVLEDIRLWESSISRGAATEGAKPTYSFGEGAELAESDAHHAVIHASFGIKVLEDDEEAATLEIKLRAAYRVPSRMTKELFEQFCKITLRLHTVPFAREWFRDMSGRMGIDPILLPLALTHPAAVPAAAIRKSCKGTKPAK